MARKRKTAKRKEYRGAWRIGGPVQRVLSALGIRSAKRRRR